MAWNVAANIRDSYLEWTVFHTGGGSFVNYVHLRIMPKRQPYKLGWCLDLITYLSSLPLYCNLCLTWKLEIFKVLLSNFGTDEVINKVRKRDKATVALSLSYCSTLTVNNVHGEPYIRVTRKLKTFVGWASVWWLIRTQAVLQGPNTLIKTLTNLESRGSLRLSAGVHFPSQELGFQSSTQSWEKDAFSQT